jgi:hypothetical protein
VFRHLIGSLKNKTRLVKKKKIIQIFYFLNLDIRESAFDLVVKGNTLYMRDREFLIRIKVFIDNYEI